MVKVQANLDELLARKARLELHIEGYKAGVSEVVGRCSQSSLRRQIIECEMALEQVRAELGEI
jgi:hypothetical protein